MDPSFASTIEKKERERREINDGTRTVYTTDDVRQILHTQHLSVMSNYDNGIQDDQ